MASLTVNGKPRNYDGDAQMPLLWYLRDTLQLTGTKYGCGEALCGACTVHVNGEAARACKVTMGAVAGKKVTTIEGLHPQGRHPLQVAWRQLNVPQCGFCQCGQIMQAAAFLRATKSPSDAQIDDAMAANICRCGCYTRIKDAIKLAAKA